MAVVVRAVRRDVRVVDDAVRRVARRERGRARVRAVGDDRELPFVGRLREQAVHEHLELIVPPTTITTITTTTSTTPTNHNHHNRTHHTHHRA